MALTINGSQETQAQTALHRPGRTPIYIRHSHHNGDRGLDDLGIVLDSRMGKAAGYVGARDLCDRHRVGSLWSEEIGSGNRRQGKR